MRLLVVLICLFSASFLHAQVTTATLDSLQQRVSLDTLAQPLQKLDSLEQSFHQKKDSLNSSYQQTIGKLNAQQERVNHKIDSLSALKLPTDKLLQQQDSISQRIQSTVASYQSKVNNLQQRFTTEVDALPLTPELQSAADKLTKTVNGFSLPDASGIAPDFSLPQTNLNLQGIDGVALPVLGVNTEGLPDMPGTDQLKQQLPDVPVVEGLEDVKALSEVKSVDDAAVLAEKQVANLDQVKELQGQAGAGEVQQLQSLTSEDAAKQLIEEQVMQQFPRSPVNHFAGKEEVLQKAMEEMAKLKNKYSSLADMKEAGKKRPNEMRGKPFFERLRPGFALQVLKGEDAILLDLNGYVGYRFTGRLAAGPGWLQRIDFNTNEYNFHDVAVVYGPRFFGEFNVWKNFCPRLEAEWLNTAIPPTVANLPLVEGSRAWVGGMLAGVKKDYQIASRIRGVAQVMFYVLGDKYKRPYSDVVNVRIGLEFKIGTSRRKESENSEN